MSSTSRKDNKQLEAEQKQIKLKPDELKDTDAEDEYKSEGGKFKKQKQNSSGADPSAQTAGVVGGAKPSNDQLEKEQKQTKLKPDELKDTDAEEEYKSEGGKFKKQSNGSGGGGSTPSNQTAGVVGGTEPSKEDVDSAAKLNPDAIKKSKL